MGFSLKHIVLGAAWLAVAGCGPAKPKVAPSKSATIVEISQPVSEDVTDFEIFTGRTEAVHAVEVRARVGGYLDKSLFVDGSDVKEGQTLFLIDDRQYQAEVLRTKGALAQAQARFDRLERDYQRSLNLFNRNQLSRQDFDLVSGDHDEARAALEVARANAALAQLNLDYCQVKAFIGGRISRRMVDPGNMIKADDTILTTIVWLDKMHVYFDVDERTLLRLRRLVSEGKIRSRRQGAEVKVFGALADEEEFPHEGAINFSENRLDPNTGTLQVRCLIDNPPPHTLSPGLFMRIKLPVGDPHRSLLVPEQAMGTDQGKKFVYIVNAKNEVVRRPVEVGALDRGMRVVSQGLKGDERVVVTGLQRIRPGVKVEPRLLESSKQVAEATPGTPITSQRKDETEKSPATATGSAKSEAQGPSRKPQARTVGSAG
jgi:RND family efflux transporter MFP subunit